MKRNLKKTFQTPLLIFVCLWVFSGVLAAFSSDYCGQTVPHDIAKEGFNSDDNFSDNAFSDPAQKQEEAPAFTGQVIYIPPGAIVPLSLDRALGSATSKVGSVAYGRIEGQMYGIPSGSVAELMVTMVEPSARFFGKPGRIQIASNRLITPNGRSVWIRGLVVDRMGDSNITAQKGKRRLVNSLGKVALASGIGAAAGAGGNAISGTNVGTGAIYGTAVGIVAGGIWAAFSKGQDVILPQGYAVNLSVQQGAQSHF